MDNRKRAEGFIRKAVMAFLAVALMYAAFNPAYVSAKTKNITLKKHDLATYESEVKNSTTIKKKGTYKVKVKLNQGQEMQGYLKFVAPKKGTYSFELSKVKEGKNKAIYGYVYGSTPGDYDYLYDVRFKTKGGTNPRLNVGSKKNGEYLKTRTGKVSLKKNQKLYLYFDFSKLYSSKAKDMTVQLKIK